MGSLWALGVGAVISGDFFGWNFGLAAGGFAGLLIATVLITVMYAGLCFSIAASLRRIGSETEPPNLAAEKNTGCGHF